MGEILGVGSFGIVRKGVFIENEQFIAAIKSIKKSEIQNDRLVLLREVQILQNIFHPNIIRVYEFYEDSRYLHIVTEYCSGGELFDRMIQKRTYKEKDAAVIMRQILLAINCIHTNNICHRDIKPENFLFQDTTETAELKMIDFGFSKYLLNDQSRTMHTSLGTPNYVAPEVIRGQYDKQCDIWSCGVLMFCLLSGEFPFRGKTTTEIFQSIMKGKVRFRGERWSNISKAGKDLIRKLLDPDPDTRINASGALMHKWFEEGALNADIQIQLKVLQNLREYKSQPTLRKEALSVIAKHYSYQHLQQLNDLFRQYDKDNTGQINQDELMEALQQIDQSLTEEDIINILQSVDIMGDNKINYNEFIAATIEAVVKIDDQWIWLAFTKFDIDNSGFITLENMQEVYKKIGKKISRKKIRKMIRQADQSKDGKISFDEFRSMFYNF